MKEVESTVFKIQYSGTFCHSCQYVFLAFTTMIYVQICHDNICRVSDATKGNKMQNYHQLQVKVRKKTTALPQLHQLADSIKY